MILTWKLGGEGHKRKVKTNLENPQTISFFRRSRQKCPAPNHAVDCGTYANDSPPVPIARLHVAARRDVLTRPLSGQFSFHQNAIEVDLTSGRTSAVCSTWWRDIG